MPDIPRKKHQGLSDEKVKELLSSKKIRGDFLDDLTDVYRYLKDWERDNGSPHPGPAWMIAHDLKISEARVARVLSEMKSDFWKEKTGSTIPWQARGTGEKSYAIVDSEKNIPLLQRGNELRTEYTRTDIVRLLSHYEVQLNIETNPFSREWIEVTIFYMRQALAAYDQMIEKQRERQAA